MCNRVQWWKWLKNELHVLPLDPAARMSFDSWERIIAQIRVMAGFGMEQFLLWHYDAASWYTCAWRAGSPVNADQRAEAETASWTSWRMLGVSRAPFDRWFMWIHDDYHSKVPTCWCFHAFSLNVPQVPPFYRWPSFRNPVGIHLHPLCIHCDVHTCFFTGHTSGSTIL